MYSFFSVSSSLRHAQSTKARIKIMSTATFTFFPIVITIPCEKERSEEIDIVKRFYGTRSKPVASVGPPHTPTPRTNSGWSNAMYRDCEVVRNCRNVCIRRVVAHRSCRITQFFMQSARQAFTTAAIELLSIIPDRRLLRYTVTKGSLPDTASLKTALNSFIRIITELRSTYVRICISDRFL